MPSFVRSLLYGLLAGAFLAVVRAPAGLDWTQFHAVEGSTAALFRAAALAAVSIFLGAGRSAFRSPRWAPGLLLGLAVGFAGAGLALSPPIDLSAPLAGRTGFGLALLVALPLLRWIAGPVPAPDGAIEGEPAAPRERIGLATAGAGLALALENLAAHLRPFGGGLALDDTLFATSFLLAALIGAAAFGALVARPALARLGLSVGATLAAASASWGLGYLMGLDTNALWLRLQRFGLDLSRIGSPGADLLLGATVLVVPGFLLGAGIVAARSPTRLRSLLLGGAVGLLLYGPLLAALSPESHEPSAALEQMRHVAIASTLLAALATLAILLRPKGLAGWIGVLLAIAAPLASSRVSMEHYHGAPWYDVELEPLAVVPAGAGTVELLRLPSGAPVVMLDGRRLTPTPDEEEFDDRRLLTAWGLLPEAVRNGEGPRVLFVGVMTARRADLLRRLTKRPIDQTAPWFEAQRALDELLLSDEARARITLIAPAEARRRIASGSYDLVLVPEVVGPIQSTQAANRIRWGVTEAPLLGSLDLPEGTVGVAWVRADSTLARRRLDGPLLLTLDRLATLVVGVVRGGPLADRSDVGVDEEPPLLFAGDEEPSRGDTRALLETIPWFRGFRLQAETAKRIARGTEAESPDSRAAHTARGIALHLAAQGPSSPFDTIEETVEIEEDALREWTAGLRKEPGMDPLTRSLWVDLAHVLTKQRTPDLVLAFVEPVADAYGPWPALDAAAARAHRELLDPDAAMERYERALPGAWSNLSLVLEAAETARELGRPERAVEICRMALEKQGARTELLRALAISLHASGDPEADGMLRQLLEHDPEDEEVRALLEVGPVGPESPTGSD
ncbi:MAG TPA: tetratricopeptide repeat protein [Planctomycetes bacterium]|nr:tetratricopeptide repeat protein [Planctomycetota bacterium]